MYRTEFDPESKPFSRVVLEAVAAIEGVDPSELPVLSDVVDVDALDSLFRARFDGTKRETDGGVYFTYAGYDVHVRTDGVVTARHTPQFHDPPR